MDPTARRTVIWANIAMLAVITIHDADHLRQARNWCYTIPPSLWFINIAVYLPNLLSLLATWRRSRAAPYLTAASSLAIAILFANVHLHRPFADIWGLWNRNFFILGADAISWSVLGLTVATGIAAAMSCAWAVGHSSAVRQSEAASRLPG